MPKSFANKSAANSTQKTPQNISISKRPPMLARASSQVKALRAMETASHSHNDESQFSEDDALEGVDILNDDKIVDDEDEKDDPNITEFLIATSKEHRAI